MKDCIKIEFIEEYIKEKGLSNTQFCKQCKISYNTFLKIKRGEYMGKIDPLFRIARLMEIHIKELFCK